MKEQFNKVKKFVKDNGNEMKVILCIASATAAGIVIGRLTSIEDARFEQQIFENDKLIKSSYIRTVK